MKSNGIQRKTPMRASSTKKAAPAPLKLLPTEPKRRQRKCATCREPFEPRSMTHKVCSAPCAETLSLQDKARKLRMERQAGLQKLKRRADYLKEAQTALNAWIRQVRDRDKPCISCNRHHHGQYHAGHFLARGSHPHLALVELNLAKQCQPCNVHLSGNQLQFRRGLIEREGLEAVEALESDNVPRKYTTDELQAIKAHYAGLVRAAKKEILP